MQQAAGPRRREHNDRRWRKMTFRLLAVAGIVSLAGAVGAVWLMQAAAAPRATARAAGASVPACRPGQLALSNGPKVSEATQQETRIFAVRNASSRPCRLDGYPVVTLFTERGGVVSFRYRDGGDQMLTSSRPHLVALAPGARGYFAINKNVCTLHYSQTAGYAAAFPPVQLIRLASSLDHCSPGDPSGHVIDISPFEKTVRAVLAG
jgi:hypothetical protein